MQLASHICRSSYENPHWSNVSGRVLVQEKVTLYGLEIENRKIPYGRIDASKATEIFIRSALVAEDLHPPRSSPPRDDISRSPLNTEQILASVADESDLRATYPFLEHNRKVRQKIETWQTRMRRHDLKDIDHALFEFYARHLQNISSIHDLNRWLRAQFDPEILNAREADLTGRADLNYDANAFPEAISLGGQPVALSYAYAPGEEHDGVTIKLSRGVAESLSPASVEWSVPGLREEQIGELLRALPKSIRRELMPLSPKITEIARDLQPGPQTLLHDLARFISHRYGIQVSVANWPADTLPKYLRPRIEITGHLNKIIAAGQRLG